MMSHLRLRRLVVGVAATALLGIQAAEADTCDGTIRGIDGVE